jgi:hypothetical protein
MTESREGKIGQVWEPNDPRLKPLARERARFEILRVCDEHFRPEALVRNVKPPHRRRTIALSRFKPSANGYTLVHEAAK